VADQVDRLAGRDGFCDGVEVVGELVEGVAVLEQRTLGGADAARVVGDDVVVVDELGDDTVPDRLGVGVAVDEENSGLLRIPVGTDGELAALYGDRQSPDVPRHAVAPSRVLVSAATDASAS
jgi:hypothetical protein